jgi:hypothetical protein
MSLWKWKDKQAKSIDEKQEGYSRSLKVNPHLQQNYISKYWKERKEKGKKCEKAKKFEVLKVQQGVVKVNLSLCLIN